MLNHIFNKHNGELKFYSIYPDKNIIFRYFNKYIIFILCFEQTGKIQTFFAIKLSTSS